MKKILVIISCLLLSAVFGLSAFFKLFPIEPFEYKIVDTTFFGWKAAVIVARLVIGVEFALAVLLLFCYRLQNTLKITIAVLALFCVHLCYVLLVKGNQSDCGCMGSLMSFTPLEGLLKNLLMIGISLLAYKYRFDFKLKFNFVADLVFIVSIITVFIVNSVDFKHAENYLNRPFETFNLDVDTVYNTSNHEKIGKPPVDIRGHKYLLAFVSATCPHCRIAGEKISVISHKNPSIPIYLFINGDDADIKTFLDKTGTGHIPHSKLNSQVFIDLAGLNLPVIYYYNKGKIDKQVDYYTLEQYHLEKWLSEN